MKWLRSFGVLLVILAPSAVHAQGIRMSADFLPLAVGNQWVYDVTTEDGRKLSEVNFAVSEHSIIKGRSYYVLSRFPFSIPSGGDIHLVRYDKAEKQFVRVLDDVEGSLFLSEGATVDVTEADASGLPVKFVLKTPAMDLTFQRGIGIVEARLQGGSGGVQIAKIASARVGEGLPPRTAGIGNRGSAPGPNPPDNRPPTAAQQAGIPAPQTPEQRRKQQADIVGAISEDNPLLMLEAGEVSEGHRFVLTVRNISDKLLPFSFASGQSYDFAVIDSATGQEIWRWSRHMFFVTQVRRTEAIPPQGQWKFEVTWNHRDNNLDRVPPGSYEVVAFVAVKPILESESLKIEVK
jgi:hypothetical protein